MGSYYFRISSQFCFYQIATIFNKLVLPQFHGNMLNFCLSIQTVYIHLWKPIFFFSILSSMGLIIQYIISTTFSLLSLSVKVHQVDGDGRNRFRDLTGRRQRISSTRSNWNAIQFFANWEFLWLGLKPLVEVLIRFYK